MSPTDKPDLVVRALGVVLAVLALSGAAYLSVVAVGQIHHDNGCSQYANALRGAVSDPWDTIDQADLRFLTPSERESATLSDRAYRQAWEDNTASQTRWNGYVARFTAAGLAEHGC